MPPAIVGLAVRSVEMGRSPGPGLRPGPVTAVEPMLAPVLALVLLVLRRFDSVHVVDTGQSADAGGAETVSGVVGAVQVADG